MTATLDRQKIIASKEYLIRVEIDGKWKIENFYTLFKEVDTLYKINNITSRIDLFIDDEKKLLKEKNKIDKSLDFIEIPSGQIINASILYLFENYNPLFTNRNDTESSTIDVRGIKHFTSSVIASTNSESFKSDNFWGTNFSSTHIRVKELKYASPGKGDFWGVGRVAKVFVDLFKYYFPNKLDREKANKKRQEVISMQIRNLKAAGFNPDEIKMLVLEQEISYKKIVNLIEEKKITTIEIIDNNSQQAT